MSQWFDRLTPAEQREWDRIERDARENLVGLVEGSAMVVSLVPSPGKTDIKFALELGLAIMLDKPIIAVVEPGVKLPAGLVRVAERVIEADLGTEEGRDALAAQIRELTK